MFKVFGIALLVIALAIAIIPNFSDCQSQGHLLTLQNGKTTSMKCHWTGRAELALAAPLVGIGGIMAFSRRRRQSLMSLSILGVITGAFVIALPTTIIGVCGSPSMICNSVMKPSLVSLGTVAIGISLVSTVLSSRIKEPV